MYAVFPTKNTRFFQVSSECVFLKNGILKALEQNLQRKTQSGKI